MDLGLYIAASGMLADQVRQDGLANDLANASTPGYKADRSVQTSFGSLLLANTSSRQAIGAIEVGTQISRTVTDLTPGPLQSTGRPLDFAVDGQGFFAVRTPAGVRYTRDGQFSVSPQGVLTDARGNPVLSPAGAPIPVGAQGTVPASAVGVFALTAPAKQGDNLFTGTAAGAASGTVKQGVLEGSGVDPIRTMVEMVAGLRAYGSGQQAIKAIDETMSQSAQSVGRVSG